MTEPGDDPEPAEEVESQLDAALGAFKPRGRSADTSPVNESGRSGMTWSPVTDVGTDSGPETEPAPRSSFQFDLGSALARLGGATEAPSTPDSPPTDATGTPDPGGSTEPLPVRARRSDADSSPDSRSADPAGGDDTLPPRPQPDATTDALPTRSPTAPAPDPDPLPTRSRAEPPAAPTSPVADRLPTRTPRIAPPVHQPAEPDPGPAEPERPAVRQQPAGRSVFDDGNPTPTLPVAGAPTLPPQPPVVRAAPSTRAADGSTLPTLPATMPATPPPVIAPIESAPSTPQLNALRSAQLRASRNDRQGKLLGRSLLAFLVVGGLVAAAMLFGRAYLFPTAWDAELTPLVDEIQSARDAEFDHAVSLVERPGSEYAPLVTTQVLGDEWDTRLPEWRALGLAGGDGAVADVQMRIATLYPAFYDAESDTIVVSDERSADARRPALRLALETVLASQLEDSPDATASPSLGLTGLDATQDLARRAYDAAATGLVATALDATADLTGVPVPVAYQLRAIDSIGAALVDDVEVAAPGDELPTAVARLDDEAAPASGGLRQPGDQQVLEPVALGADDWALIWGTRLSPAVVGEMADSLAADSYSVVDRSGVTCFVAVFQTGSDADGAALLANLTSWAAAAPAGASAVATQLAPNRAQLEACDPGADAAAAPSAVAADLVIRRQLDRLAG